MKVVILQFPPAFLSGVDVHLRTLFSNTLCLCGETAKRQFEVKI
jgi:hypothetical protein